METEQILHELERATGRFPRAAVEAAVMRREEITPELLQILGDTTERAVEIDAERDYMAHLYAMFLLAQFREVCAYPLIVKFASLPGELPHSLCGDFITEDLGKVLASVCGGDLAGIQSLIENEAVNEWVRGAALSSLATLVAVGQKSRDEIVSYFVQLFRGKLEREFSHVWNELVSCTADLYPGELIADIERAYEDGLVEPGYIGWADVNDDLAVIAYATGQYQLPRNLKLSVHSGSDKFSIYPLMRRALRKFNAGVHLKTAGTTWLEELIGLAEAGGDGLSLAKEVYTEAFAHRDELCEPYAAVIDIHYDRLPAPADVQGWTSEQYTSALRHDQSNPGFNPDVRQLLHVGYKVASKMGVRYLNMLDQCEESISRNVTQNLFERHIRPLFLEN